ncbi:hypothetical protein BK022_01755 [Methylorubrum extorquens]|uniref:Antitoxin-like ribbon-helix-helix domain-containing protein n=1 Tax=Methylorubrum extorquens TaxID=408 RepID=A0A1S1PAP2_METEX|nr:hypothetical protein BK022_01755 [Methylorubrum extorquens]
MRLPSAATRNPRPRTPPRSCSTRRRSRPPSGKPQDVKLTVYVPPAASKRLRLMCIEHDRDLNSYLREGLDMVLEKYGQPSLAEFAKK